MTSAYNDELKHKLYCEHENKINVIENITLIMPNIKLKNRNVIWSVANVFGI